jgi:hypothetical protein
MDTARSNIVRNCFALLVAFAFGVLVANPSGFIWRARYWVPAGDRAAALARLVEAEPHGAESELTSALGSDDADLRFSAAVHLAGRGDKRGLAELVKATDAKYPGARDRLEASLINPEILDQYESAGEWYAATHHVLHFQPTVRWSGTSVN